jgi:hypothetical protein
MRHIKVFKSSDAKVHIAALPHNDELSGVTFGNHTFVGINLEQPFRAVQNDEAILPPVCDHCAKANGNLKRTGDQFSASPNESIDRFRNGRHLKVGLHRAPIGVENQLGLRVRKPKARSVIGAPNEFVAESVRIEIYGCFQVVDRQAYTIYSAKQRSGLRHQWRLTSD